jgi:hypothetical protein
MRLLSDEQQSHQRYAQRTHRLRTATYPSQHTRTIKLQVVTLQLRASDRTVSGAGLCVRARGLTCYLCDLLKNGCDNVPGACGDVRQPTNSNETKVLRPQAPWLTNRTVSGLFTNILYTFRPHDHIGHPSGAVASAWWCHATPCLNPPPYSYNRK